MVEKQKKAVAEQSGVCRRNRRRSRGMNSLYISAREKEEEEPAAPSPAQRVRELEGGNERESRSSPGIESRLTQPSPQGGGKGGRGDPGGGMCLCVSMAPHYVQETKER